MTLRIQVRFCGGCNPEIERGAVVRQIMELLGEKAQWTFDAHPRQPVDVILNISGCPHACLDEELDEKVPPLNTKIPAISVQGRQVNRNPLAENQLAWCVAKKLIAMDNQ
jgi:hypothetical protein